MPLFGRKRHDKNATDNTDTANYDDATGTTGINKLHKNQHAQNDPTYPPSNAPGAGAGAGAYGTQQEHGHGHGVGVGGGGGGAGRGQQGGYSMQDDGSYMRDDEYGGGGGGGQPGYGGTRASGGGAAADSRGNPAHPGPGGGGGGSRAVGKVETAIGDMLGSENLKRKGLEKEQESQALKVQAAELSEAEHLEQEALARRSRAVAHGAHPDHRHLGSHNPGAGGGAMNERGGGANYGAGGDARGARGGY